MVAVRLSKEKKQRWEDYVEDSHQPTLSQLIRIATEREIARDNPLEPPEEGETDSREPAPAVMHKLEQILNKLQSLDRRLSAIESDRYGDEDLTKLATNVYRILPGSVPEIQHAIVQKQGESSVEETEGDIAYMFEELVDSSQEAGHINRNLSQSDSRPCTGSIADIAVILDADEEAVELALNRLQSTTHSVYSTESAAGTVHYYKED